MAVERVEVDITTRGNGNVVKRAFDEIAYAADRTTRSLYLFNRAVYTIGLAGGVAAIARLSDSLTEMQNRLRLTTTSTQQMLSVQQQLFDVAIRSRSSFEGTAEIYNRMALSAKELGLNTSQLVDVTETLNKASILSGASTREANAALIQLGQGIASNRLGGDELRAVLEQLPYVADLIAKSLGVTRGELRELGSEGKLSAQVVIDALTKAKVSVDQLFAGTDVTIGQALNVVMTQFTRMFNEFKQDTGIFDAMAKAILFLGEHIKAITITVIGFGTALAASFAVNSVSTLLGAFTQVGKAIASKAALQVVEAQSQVAGLVAQQTKTAAVLAYLPALIKQIELEAELLLIESEITQLELANAYLAGNVVAQTAAEDALLRVKSEMLVVENALTGATSRLSAARQTQVAVDAELIAAESTLAARQATASGFMARFAGMFPTLAGVVARVGSAFGALGSVIAANPLGAVVVVLVTLIGLLFSFGNQIKVTGDGVIGLRDYVVAAFQVMLRVAEPVLNWLGQAFGDLWNFIKDGLVAVYNVWASIWSQILSIMASILNAIIGIVLGTIDGISAVFWELPKVAGDVGYSLANFFIEGFGKLVEYVLKGVNKMIDALNGMISFLGADKAAEFFGFSGTIDRISEDSGISGIGNPYAGAGRDAAGKFAAAFKGAMGKDYVGDIASGISTALSAANTAILNQAYFNKGYAGIYGNNNPAPGAGTGTTTPGTGGGGGGEVSKTFQDLINALNAEAQAEAATTLQRTIAQGVLKLEQQLKRGLTETERQLAIETLLHVEILKEEGKVLEELQGPQEQLQIRLAAINDLFRQGRIDANEYATAMRKAFAESTPTTFTSGLLNGLQRVAAEMDNIGQTASDWVVQSFASASDAIVEFAKTGQFNLRQFFNDIFANLLKLATNQLFSMAISSLLGMPAGGIGGFGSIFGFASGGQILPSGTGNTDSQFVYFNKRPDERVDILTPAQQQKQADQMNGAAMAGGGGGSTQMNNHIINVVDPKMVGDYLTTPDGHKAVLNIIRLNGDQVKQVVRG